jgi:magnesium transporter
MIVIIAHSSTLIQKITPTTVSTHGKISKMVEHLKHGRLRWACLKNPTTVEVHKILKEFDVSPVLMNDLTTPVPKNSVHRLESTIKVTLDFPVVKRIDASHPYEAKFIFGKNYIITVQYEEMEGIDRFKRQFEVATTIRKHQKHLTGADIFLSLLSSIYESSASKLDTMESKLAEIEDLIFSNNERQMVADISAVSKKLITFRHILRAHEDLFRDLKTQFDTVYGEKYTPELQSIQSQYFLLQRHTNTLFDTLTALRETNTAMLTTRQNEVIKNLTIMAFITFPLTLISSMFGMNVHTAPIIGEPGDFWVIVGIMITASIGFFGFFKYKGWV